MDWMHFGYCLIRFDWLYGIFKISVSNFDFVTLFNDNNEN